MEFTNFFAFSALLFLPFLFYLIKLFPPAPKKVFFSSLFLIKKIERPKVSKDKFPLWLLIFRIILVFLIILFFSKPYFNSNQKINDNSIKDYVIITDIGWSMAKEWDKFSSIVNDISLEAEKNNKNIFFYHSNQQNINNFQKFDSAFSINEFLKRISPTAWQSDKTILKKVIDNNFNFSANKVFYIFSRLDTSRLDVHLDNIKMLQKKSKESVIIDPVSEIIYINNVNINKNNIEIDISRYGYLNTKKKFNLKLLDITNQVIFNKTLFFDNNKKNFLLKESFPIEIINLLKKIEIVGENHAAAKYYFDDNSKKKKIGILSQYSQNDNSPLLSSIYYIKKALNDNNILKIGNLNELLAFGSAIIILPDKEYIKKEDHKKVLDWINSGGNIIQFSGENLSVDKDNLFTFNNPTLSIRYIAKNLGTNNALSIANFDRKSIFKGLEIPNDIKLKKQLMINNNIEGLKAEASLTDNTPLVTSKSIGLGKIILFHVTSNNEWSNLPISSLFLNMLNRIVLLSDQKLFSSNEVLSLKLEIDTYGNLKKSNKIINIDNRFVIDKTTPSKRIPPGVYENNQESIALNLSGKINSSFFYYNNNNTKIYSSFENTIIDLSSYILKIILIMFIADILITVFIKNSFKIPKINLVSKKNFSILIFLFLIFVNNTIANPLANNTYLAYIKSQEKEINLKSENGLNTIKNLLSSRTSVTPAGVIEIDINKDPIYFFPFLYWPLTINSEIPDTLVKKKIKNYLNNGGILLFDIIGFPRDDFNLNSKDYKKIKNILTNLEAYNLSPMSNKHTLTKSFYLLKKFPGKWDNKIILTDNTNLNLKDGVNSIILGFNDWASAWALDDNKQPLYPVVPGGERQRELSYRFGINITMYALTGNYKSDQVHSKSILKRLNKYR